jgi:hypothetical protein
MVVAAIENGYFIESNVSVSSDSQIFQFRIRR